MGGNVYNLWNKWEEMLDINWIIFFFVLLNAVVSFLPLLPNLFSEAFLVPSTLGVGIVFRSVHVLLYSCCTGGSFSALP
eukprot:UN0280